METSNLSNAALNTLVIRVLKKLRGDLNSITEIQLEMKETLVEIKNNLQGINSRVDEARNQISVLEHKEAKTTIQNSRKKKELKKKMRIV